MERSSKSPSTSLAKADGSSRRKKGSKATVPTVTHGNDGNTGEAGKPERTAGHTASVLGGRNQVRFLEDRGGELTKRMLRSTRERSSDPRMEGPVRSESIYLVSF